MIFNSPDQSEFAYEFERLKAIESQALQDIYGVRFNIPSAPQEFLQIFSEGVLSSNQLSLFHFPMLEIPQINPDPYHLYHEDIRAMSALNLTYPNWHTISTFADQNLINASLMPEAYYWRDIALGKTSPPTTFAHWLLVENIEKPQCNQAYPQSQITEALNLPNGRYISWEKIEERLQSQKFKAWSEATFQGFRLKWRLPDILELNTIANRLMRHSTSQVYEWTSTPLLAPAAGSRAMVTNYYQLGGAHHRVDKELTGWSPAMIDCDQPTYQSSSGGVAFRLVAELVK